LLGVGNPDQREMLLPIAGGGKVAANEEAKALAAVKPAARKKAS
jgi:hypothetical protein